MAANSDTGRENRLRIRDLGVRIGRLAPGRFNAITDVPGVLVGHETVVRGEPAGDRVAGIARTGVTVIYPRRSIWREHVYAGSFSLNGNGEMTGLLWVEESGLLSTPIGLTNTHSVGLVRDAFISYHFARNPDSRIRWMMPVVTETWDGYLNDINGMHVSRENVFHALDAADGGPVAEGSVGGGTGMTCYEFKGGIGTSSRQASLAGRVYTVGTLVQANYGRRYQLLVDGVPVGRAISLREIPGRLDLPPVEAPPSPPAAAREGSIVIVIATDVPLLADQCKRLARRASMGLARVGSFAADNSGDIFLAFSTANVIPGEPAGPAGRPFDVTTIDHESMSVLFEAVVESVEESILNALCAATTVTGIRSHTAHALPLERLKEVLDGRRR
jgi:D-aminopeptidase